jgi:pimeloyl-ACP methyl ester carboxylesterase
MTVERTSLVPSLPWFGEALLPRQGRRGGRLAPAILAPRYELVDERFGRLSYFSNQADHASGTHAPALVLIHAPQLGAGAHQLRRLFESFRDDRVVFALDLPGFGESECPAHTALSAELCVAAIESVVERAPSNGDPAVDLIAVGLSAEYAAKLAAQRPERVRSLGLIDPTGFASEWERGAFERAARRGRSLWSFALLERLGLEPLLYGSLVAGLSLRCLAVRARASTNAQALRYARAAAQRPGSERGALAFLAGALYPRESPQAIYTRVHRPTLILTTQPAERFGELARFVKWRDHFSAQRLSPLDLGTRAGTEGVVEALRDFWAGPARPSRV